jgi:sugar lactone lactonase YvrE
MKVEIFSEEKCELSEGPVWHAKRQSLFWLDIPNKCLYEKNFYSCKKYYDTKWKLPFITSSLAISEKSEDFLWAVTANSFGEICLETGQYTPVITLPILEGFRPNDGGTAPDGSFWFGTMEEKPTGRKGQVFRISPEGKLTKQLDAIGIPNTFCWSADASIFYLSDSFRQQMFSYSVDKGELLERSKKIHVDLTGGAVTSDGGAIDLIGNMWNAQWGGSRVSCYNSAGQLLQLIEMPVPQPTSCCIGGPGNLHLFVTSAREGLSEQEIEECPFSGGVFVTELTTPGLEVKPFCLER